MRKFKVESEGGLFDIYEVNPDGCNCVSKGDVFLKCSVIGIAVPSAESVDIPFFLEAAELGQGVKRAA